MHIAIIGLGYVGLPLALQFARSGVKVLGLDIDPAKADAINAGRSYIRHIGAEAVREQVEAGRFSASTDFASIKELEAVIICVPTPLNKNREPDLSYVLNTGRAIAPHLSKGTRVVLESTTYPGTTDEDLRTVLEEGSGLKAGVVFTWPTRPSGRIRAIRSAGCRRSPKSSAATPRLSGAGEGALFHRRLGCV